MKKSRQQWLFIEPTLVALLIALSLGTVGCGDDDDDDGGVSASATRGGMVYDKSWTVAASSVTSSAVEPSGDHPIWGRQNTNTRSGSDTWRCKECHGWDYKGADGAYGPGSSHHTGFPGVLEFARAQTTTREDLIGALSGDIADHDFGPNGLNQLDDTDIANLADFMIEGLIDMDDFIDSATKASNGDTSNGARLYAGAGQCQGCHGERGTQILFDDGEESVGSLANDNPWEILHKIRWGQPGSSPAMPSALRNGLSDADANDLLAYCQTLPVTWACGDGFVDGDEECDDGNTADGDGCAADCTTEVAAGGCGDGTVDAGEECDDGNTSDGDGCAADCTTEAGAGACGDGTVDAGEECDDGNTADGDGCAADCTVEATINGAALFTSECGACHTGNGLGSGSVVDVTGATAQAITDAIAGVPLMNSISLTAEEIQAIGDAL